MVALHFLSSQAFLLFHFGCFLLWQPVWQGEQKVYLGQAALIVGAATLLVASESWWLMALWLCEVMPTRQPFASRQATIRDPVNVLPEPGGP